MTELTKTAAAVRILCVAHSSNRKTGNIAQTYSSRNTCPRRCALHNSCYAQSGFHTRMQWDRTEPEAPAADNICTPENIGEWIRENVAIGALIRHNVAGDMSANGSDILDINLVKKLTAAFEGRRAYTYTHCAPVPANFGIVRRAIKKGFVINFSCENVYTADLIVSKGLPAVLAVPEILPRGAKSPAGRSLVMCPAQTHENINCANCALCARAGRKSIVCFAAHGNKKAIAIKAIEAANK